MMVVSDTSVLTTLIHVSRQGLLHELYGSLLIPPAVRDELLRAHARLPDFLQVHPVRDSAEVRRLEVELDRGEAEAIVLAREVRADLLLIDEKLGRRIAVREGLRIAGLMGVLVEAKHRGLVKSLRDLVQQLESEAGFRVAEPVRREAFRLGGE